MADPFAQLPAVEVRYLGRKVGAVAMDRWGKLNEIQGAAILLSSPASSYMTGSLLTVDGGWTAK